MINLIKRTLIVCSLFLTACETIQEEPVQKVEIAKPVEQIIEKPRPPQALLNASRSDIILVQSTLKALGYPVGTVDGFWGKQTSKAIRLFEQKKGLPSLNGELSDLNFNALKNEDVSYIAPVVQKKSNTIASKLRSPIPDRNSPELIILEQSYALMSKANPYSRKVNDLKSGVGLYVLSLQNGWYEVETVSKEYGFIKEN